MNLKVPAHQAPYETINVTFSHPNITDRLGRLRPLVVETGMDGVSWDYNLVTQKQQTYAGEVIQILSANIGQLRIKGTVRDYVELDTIYAWFKEYMFNLRQENVSSMQQPVMVSYPHRGWRWEVYIVDAPGYHLGRQVVAPEWEVICEFFHPEDRDLISRETRNQFTETLHTNSAVPREILRNYNGIYSSPTPTMGEGVSSGLIDNVTREEMASVLGENFQNMIGAWNTGDFGRFAFDVTGTDKRTQNIFKTSEEYYESIFGTNVIANLKASSGNANPTGTSGTFTANWPGDAAPTDIKAMWLATKGREAGLPDELLVMASLVETGGRLNSGQSVRFGDRDSVGLFQIRIGIHTPASIGDSASEAHWSSWDQVKKAEYWEIAENSVKWFIKNANGVRPRPTEPFTAANLGKWCQDTERSGFPDRYEQRYQEAKDLIKNLNEYIASENRTSSGGGKVITGKGGYVYPLSVRGRSLGGIAAHNSRPLGNWQSDQAIDLAVPPGTLVYATEDSVVTRVNLARTNQHGGNIFGAQITLQGKTSGNNFFYTHITSVPSNIVVMKQLKAGDVIGKVTRWDANVASSHLHLGMSPGNIEQYLSTHF
jgi:murein DD-endopeptidase MepM/ murein hydrolase activator NlpD